MKRADRSQLSAPTSTRPRGFTLIELLVVIAIIAVLGALTALGYRGVANDAKLSSGKNTVMAVLDTARGLAIKRNNVTLVVFHPRMKGKSQFVEAVITEWTGDTALAHNGGPAVPAIVDRFVPIEGVQPRPLPQGLKVAIPYYPDGTNSGDRTWQTSSHLPAISASGQGEAPGQVVGIMYDATGNTILQNSATDATRAWVDLDNDRLQEIGGASIDYFGLIIPLIPTPLFTGGYFDQRFEGEEPYVGLAQFLAVFDDDEARSIYNVNQWATPPNPNAFLTRRNDLSEYITQNADRIHFNRYTGVAMK